VIEDDKDALDELLAAESAPPERRPWHYSILVIGIALGAIVALFMLLVVLPLVAGAIANVLSFILRVLAGT
jgi:hypothetical protein